MTAERDPVEELIASISDGQPVDWEEALGKLPPAQRERARALREISGIADFSRALQPGSEASLPERWGGVLLLERLSAGVKADVFRAWDPALQREIALKLLRQGLDDAALLDEGRAVASIRHPNVVTVHGIDRRDERIGLTMELIRGVDLEHLVGLRGALPADEVAELGMQVGSALTAVHAAGILHRDVKPANVVRDAGGRFVLADFGLGVRGVDASLRAAGASGTPMYMAPEVLAGEPPSERSDVYSLGMLLRFALTGRHPFEAKTIEELIPAAARGPATALSTTHADAPPDLVRAIERASAPQARDRFASARELLESLGSGHAASAGAKAGSRRGLAIALGLIAVAAVALGIVSTQRAPEPESVAVAEPMPTAPAVYDVEANLLRRGPEAAQRLANGDRVRPGDRLSLEFQATRPAWVYVLNEDERGELYLLFPQPAFDRGNPLPADTTCILPGAAGGQEVGWTVTSAGGREHFLIIASPEPVAELEAELDKLPAPSRDRPIQYAAIPQGTLDRLRGVGGIQEVAPSPPPPPGDARSLDRFRSLAGRESGVRGVWVRQVVLENPAP